MTSDVKLLEIMRFCQFMYLFANMINDPLRMLKALRNYGIRNHNDKNIHFKFIHLKEVLFVLPPISENIVLCKTAKSD